MKNYFYEMRGEWDEQTINYQGSFMNVLENAIDMGVFKCVRVYGPEYADWTKIKQSLNDLFLDYI